MRDLVTFYRERLDLFKNNDPWRLALNNQDDELLISSLVDTCRDFDVQSPDDYILGLKKIVSLAFLQGGEPLKPLIKKLRTQGFWKDFQLGEAFYALGCDALGISHPLPYPTQHPKGSLLLETGSHLVDGGVPHLIMSGELALIWLYLGWKHDQDRLIHAALKWIHMAVAFFDHENRPFHGLWLRESEYDPLSFLTLYSLLFSVASHLIVGSKIGYLKETLLSDLKDIEDEAFQKPPYFLVLMARAFEALAEEKKPPEVDENFTLSEYDESLGFLSAQSQDMSFACSFCGVNTGLGALHKSQVRIVSFGPHFTPLADSDRYGIYRTAVGAANPMRDLEIEKGKESFEVKGWTQLISPFIRDVSHKNFTLTEPGKQWLFFSAQNKDQKMIFQARLSELDDQHPLFFAYFISADKAWIKGEKPFVPGTLNRYHGPSSSLSFERGEEKLSLAPHEETDMYLIPLAGKQHFWSADFLVAFLLNEKLKAYSWKIS